MTDFGSQLVVLESSGDLTYSFCNSGSTPVYPTASTPALSVTTGPRSGSNIAAVGYYEDDIVYADVFWQDSGFSLQHGRYQCDMDDGTYALVSHESPSAALASDADMPDVSVFTGLAAVRLAARNATRLFFHDMTAGLHQLEHTSAGKWVYAGPVNPDGHLQGPSVGAAAAGGGDGDGATDMYTVLPRSDANLDIASTADGSSWDVESTPRSLANSDTSGSSTQNFTVNTTEVIFANLQAWDGGIGNLGLAVDKDRSRYVFYIGSDKGLRYVSAVQDTNLGAWSTYDPLGTAYWPLADDADANFAVASDPAGYEIRLYYLSGGAMTEVARVGRRDGWARAAALPTTATTTKSKASSTVTATASGDNTSSGPGSGADPSAATNTATAAGRTTTAGGSSSDHPQGLSSAAAAGIGVAGCVGILIVAGVAGGCWWRRRKNNKTRGEKYASGPCRADDNDEYEEGEDGPGGGAADHIYCGPGDAKAYLGHFANAERASPTTPHFRDREDSLDHHHVPQSLGRRSFAKDDATTMVTSTTTTTSPPLSAVVVPPVVNVVYVPAHELPAHNSMTQPFRAEVSETPVSPPAPPSELAATNESLSFVPRSIFNQRQSRPPRSAAAAAAAAAGPTTGQVVSFATTESTGRTSLGQGAPTMSPLTEKSSGGSRRG